MKDSPEMCRVAGRECVRAEAGFPAQASRGPLSFHSGLIFWTPLLYLDAWSSGRLPPPSWFPSGALHSAGLSRSISHVWPSKTAGKTSLSLCAAGKGGFFQEREWLPPSERAQSWHAMLVDVFLTLRSTPYQTSMWVLTAAQRFPILSCSVRKMRVFKTFFALFLLQQFLLLFFLPAEINDPQS